MIEPILREEGVPTDLSAVVLVESGGQPVAGVTEAGSTPRAKRYCASEAMPVMRPVWAVRIGSNQALSMNTSVVASDTLGSLDLASWNQQVGGINGYQGTVTDSVGGGRLTVNFTGSQSFLGTLTGPGNLTLTGGGALNLTGTNSFSGATIVSNASYYVNGLHNGGVITVISNGVVGGSRPISTLYVDRGGTYAPGNSLATQLVASLTLTNLSRHLRELFTIAGFSQVFIIK